MPITAQSADGVLHQFPDGTPDAVIDKTMQDYAAQNKAPQGMTGGFQGQILRAGTLGGIDMLQGATGATLNTLADKIEGKKGTPSWHDYYDKELARARAEGDQYQADHPVLSAVGQTIGGLMDFNPEAAAAGATKTVGGVMKTALKSAGYGAALGGTQGFVSGRGGFENRLESAGTGAVAGGAVGFALPLAVAGGSALYSLGKGAITGALPDEVVNATLSKGIGSLGNTDADASEAMLDRLEAVRDVDRKNTQVAWKQAGIDETTPITTAPLKGVVQDYMDGLTRSAKSKIPPDVMAVFKDFGEKEPLQEIQDWRSDISTAFRAARKNGDANGLRVLGGLQDHIENFLGDLPATAGSMSEEDLARYNIARAATKSFKERFAAPGSPVATALSPKEFGTAAESNTANLFLKPNTRAGAPEAFQSYLKAVGDDPGGLQAARDAFAQKFLQAAQTQGVDAAGNATISPTAISKFIDQYDHVIGSKIFTNDQRTMIDALGNVADLSNKSGPKRFVEMVARKLGPAAAGYAGFHVGGVPGMVAGATLGTGASRLVTAIDNAPRDAALRLLAASLNDPALAKAMVMPTASASRIPLSMQAKIYGVLAGRAGAGVASLTSQPQPAQ